MLEILIKHCITFAVNKTSEQHNGNIK